ncbi:hypothetical protein BC831DRAFT_117685 [Entophlyctis helioformis]|nr:hypothetical protein BC831DRAFT_117685 [Entophlyctis helioformis]
MALSMALSMQAVKHQLSVSRWPASACFPRVLFHRSAMGNANSSEEDEGVWSPTNAAAALPPVQPSALQLDQQQKQQQQQQQHLRRLSEPAAVRGSNEPAAIPTATPTATPVSLSAPSASHHLQSLEAASGPHVAAHAAARPPSAPHTTHDARLPPLPSIPSGAAITAGSQSTTLVMPGRSAPMSMPVPVPVPTGPSAAASSAKAAAMAGSAGSALVHNSPSWDLPGCVGHVRLVRRHIEYPGPHIAVDIVGTDRCKLCICICICFWIRRRQCRQRQQCQQCELAGQTAWPPAVAIQQQAVRHHRPQSLCCRLVFPHTAAAAVATINAYSSRIVTHCSDGRIGSTHADSRCSVVAPQQTVRETRQRDEHKHSNARCAWLCAARGRDELQELCKDPALVWAGWTGAAGSLAVGFISLCFVVIGGSCQTSRVRCGWQSVYVELLDELLDVLLALECPADALPTD